VNVTIPLPGLLLRHNLALITLQV